MKLFKNLFVVLISCPVIAGADVLIERELFNAYNGESYICKIHSDLQTELVNEGISVGKFATELSSSPENFKKWIDDLKALSKNKTFSMESKTISQYAHRGLKQYSVFAGSKKMTFYTLKQHKPKARKAKLGSIEHQVKNDNGNVQRVRGQADYACKMAKLKL